MSSFKSSSVVISEKATPVTPSISGDLTVVARAGALKVYDGTTEKSVAFNEELGTAASADTVSPFSIVSQSALQLSIPTSNPVLASGNFDITSSVPNGILEFGARSAPITAVVQTHADPIDVWENGMFITTIPASSWMQLKGSETGLTDLNVATEWYVEIATGDTIPRSNDPRFGYSSLRTKDIVDLPQFASGLLAMGGGWMNSDAKNGIGIAVLDTGIKWEETIQTLYLDPQLVALKLKEYELVPSISANILNLTYSNSDYAMISFGTPDITSTSIIANESTGIYINTTGFAVQAPSGAAITVGSSTLGIASGQPVTSSFGFADQSIAPNVGEILIADVSGKIVPSGVLVTSVATTDTTVNLTGSQSISGVKTFTDTIAVPSTSGHGILVGSTYGWRDITSSIDVRGLGANDPSFNVFKGGVRQYQFGVSDEVFSDFHMPHDYKLGSDLFVHVHWSHNSALVLGGNCVWGWEATYATGHDLGTFSNNVTVTVTGACSTTQYRHMISEVQLSSPGGTGGKLDTNALMVDGIVKVRLFLQSNNITSSGAVPDPFVIMTDIHYQSTNMATLNKSPNFFG